MPFALLTLGILFIVIGFQDTYKQFGAQVQKDFTGPNSFIWFIIAIGAVGSLGYVKELEGFSRAMLALILISLFIGAVNKGGFFNNLSTGLSSGDTASVDPIGTPIVGSPSGNAGGGGGILGTIVGAGISLL